VSTGDPFQVFPLKYQPLFERPNTDTPYDHLVVQVDGVTWSATDDFAAGPGNFYRINPVAGEVSFGSYNLATGKGNGSVPVKEASIVAVTYRYVADSVAGGAAGNVGPGTITALRTPVLGITAVTNLAAGFDGADEEPIDDTKRRAPEALKTRDRAITAEDYEHLVTDNFTDVVIVRCLEPRVQDQDNNPYWKKGDPWTFAGILRAPGDSNVIIVPPSGSGIARPVPTNQLLQRVKAYLDKRRDLTANLAVVGPAYLPIIVTVDVKVWQAAIDAGLVPSVADVLTATRNSIVQFLHPTSGGPKDASGNPVGWKVGQNVYIPDLFQAIAPSEQVGYIATLLVQADTPAYHDPSLPYNPLAERPFVLGAPGASVRVADYELVCSALPAQHQVTGNAV
jgi:predicted phage baseplate assembly protein